MDIFTFSNGLEEQIKAMADSGKSKEGLTHASEMMGLVQELMHDLQQFTYNYVFARPEDEIRFFKETKPVLLSQYYYYKKLFDIALFDSFKDPESKKRYYESVLTKLEDFARKHNEFYLYCMTGQTSFDDTYFMRKEKMFSGMMDARFSTGYEDKLARLLANELIRKHVLDLISKVDDRRKYSHLTWTGNKTDAIELLVAIQASGSVNDGKSEIKKLIEAFEQFFNIKFGNYYDYMKNIRSRKGGTSIFLDTLKSKYLDRLDRLEE